jgi:threonine/homoserine/homoserine lactone efflux protein
MHHFDAIACIETTGRHIMSFQNYGFFLPACFAINMALGPNNVLSLSNGARDGVRSSIFATFGRLLAFAVMIAIAGFGLGALLRRPAAG